MILLLLQRCGLLVSLNAERVADRVDALVAQVFGLSEYIRVRNVLVLSRLLEQLNQLLVVGLHVVEFNMDGALSLPRAVQVCNRLLEIGYLVPEPIVLT